MTGAESNTVNEHTLQTLVEDTRTFQARNRDTLNAIPAPNSCAACGEASRHHATSWVRRNNGTAEFHRYEAPDNALILARMQARRASKQGQ